jgi:hypothetical protein
MASRSTRAERERAVALALDGLSPAEIARELKRSRTTILNWLRTAGVSTARIRAERLDARRKQALAEYEASLPHAAATAIAHSLGISPTLMLRWVREAGLPVRPLGHRVWPHQRSNAVERALSGDDLDAIARDAGVGVEIVLRWVREDTDMGSRARHFVHRCEQWREFAAQHRRAPYVFEDRRADSEVGQWGSYMRARKRDGRLSDDEIAALEALPYWQWTVDHTRSRDPIRPLLGDADEHFAMRCGEWTEWVLTHGRLPQIPGRSREENSIARWAVNQRTRYRAGELPAKRAAALSVLPLWQWEVSSVKQFKRGAYGAFLRPVVVGRDQLAREQSAERIKQTHMSFAKRGLWPFHRVPIGYQLAGERPCGLVPSSDAPRVVAAFEARRASPPASLTTLSRRLGMTIAGVRSMLANRVYLGEIHIGENVNHAAHEPIVDRWTFDAVQATFGVHPSAPRKVSGRHAAAPYTSAMLEDLIRCAGCGYAMRFNRRYSRSGDYYICRTNSVREQCRAPATINASRVEPHVAAAAMRELEALHIHASRRTGEYDKLRREAEAWADLTTEEKNGFLRSLIDAVVVKSAGRRNVLAADRVRIFALGTLGDLRYQDGGAPMPFPDRDDERLLGAMIRRPPSM